MTDPNHPTDPPHSAGNPEPAPAEHTFWFRTTGGSLYLIPDGVELPSGDLELMTLKGARRRVDAAAAAPYQVEKDDAKQHLEKQLRSGIEKFSAGLLDAWRSGRSSYKESTARSHDAQRESVPHERASTTDDSTGSGAPGDTAGTEVPRDTAGSEVSCEPLGSEESPRDGSANSSGDAKEQHAAAGAEAEPTARSRAPKSSMEYELGAEYAEMGAQVVRTVSDVVAGSLTWLSERLRQTAEEHRREDENAEPKE